MEKVRPWCVQPSDRGRLNIRSESTGVLLCVSVCVMSSGVCCVCDDLWSMLFALYSSCCVVVCVIQCYQPEHSHWASNILHYSSHRHTQATGTLPLDSDLIFSIVRMTEDRDKWIKYVHGVANPRIEDG